MHQSILIASLAILQIFQTVADSLQHNVECIKMQVDVHLCGQSSPFEIDILITDLQLHYNYITRVFYI